MGESGMFRKVAVWAALLVTLGLCVLLLRENLAGSRGEITSEPGPSTHPLALPSPPGATAIEEAGERESRRVELIPDLTIGDGWWVHSEALLNWPRGIAVDDRGRLFVADAGDRHVKVFGPDGSFVQLLGKEGEGPGEYREPVAVAVTGDKVVVSDRRAKRLVVWELEGLRHAATHNLEIQEQIYFLKGDTNGSLVASYTDYARYGVPDTQVFVGLDLEGKVLREFGRIKLHPLPYIQRQRTGGGATTYFALGIGIPEPWFEIAQSGEVFLTAGDEYEVTIFSSTGEVLDTIRVDWPRDRVSEEEIERAEDEYRNPQASSFPPVKEWEIQSVEWPELEPALARGVSHRSISEVGRALRMDGHGHLYVFPYVRFPWGSDERDRPVDVYSSGGELLFSGMMPNRNWTAAWGDYVFAVEEGSHENPIIVRYRLVESF